MFLAAPCLPTAFLRRLSTMALGHLCTQQRQRRVSVDKQNKGHQSLENEEAEETFQEGMVHSCQGRAAFEPKDSSTTHLSGILTLPDESTQPGAGAGATSSPLTIASSSACIIHVAAT